MHRAMLERHLVQNCKPAGVQNGANVLCNKLSFVFSLLLLETLPPCRPGHSQS